MPDALANRLRSCGDVPSMLDCILDQGLELTGTALGNIQLVNWQAGYLEIASQRGFDDEFLKFFQRVKADDGSACARALKARGAILVEDIDSDKEFSPLARATILNAGVRAVQSTPLISTSGAFVGMLSTHFTAVHCPSAREIAAIKLLVQIAANAIIAQRARGREPIAPSLDAIATSRELTLRIAREEEGRALRGG